MVGFLFVIQKFLFKPLKSLENNMYQIITEIFETFYDPKCFFYTE